MRAPLILTVLLAGTMPAFADDAACKAVGDAVVKMAETPVRQTITVERGSTVIKSDVVKTADKMYIHVQNRWVTKPYDTKKEAAEARDKMRLADAECSRAGQEAVDGVPTDVYKVHTKIEGQESDMQLWIATATGLPIKVVATHAESQMKSENRLAYDNVVVPPGAP